MLINHYDFPRENVTVLLDGDADAYKIKKEFSKIKKQREDLLTIFRQTKLMSINHL